MLQENGWFRQSSHQKPVLSALFFSFYYSALTCSWNWTRAAGAHLRPAECWSVSPEVCCSAPPFFWAFLVGSEPLSGATRHRWPQRAGGRCCCPESGWWLSAGLDGRLPGTPPHGSSKRTKKIGPHDNRWCCAIRKYLTQSAGTHLVRHECWDRASNLMVVNVGSGRAQQEEEEPNWHRNLQDRFQQNCLLQSHKRHGWLVQETHTACRHMRVMHWTQRTCSSTRQHMTKKVMHVHVQSCEKGFGTREV